MSGIPLYKSSPINPVRSSDQPEVSSTSTATAYPPARPGAAAIPTPTATTAHLPSTTSPPPPQPGAVPTPFSSGPPKAGAAPPPPPPAPAALPQPYPPQMALSPPTSSIGTPAPRSTTSISTTSISAVPPHPIHLPGYQQNINAVNMSSDQRRALEAHEEAGSDAAATSPSGTMWEAAKSWAASAGKKLEEVEKEAWRKVGGTGSS